MALATQALVCPHLISPTSCSTSASTSGRSTSSSASSSTCSFPAAPGLLLNTQRLGRLGLGAFGRVTIAAEGEGSISKRWNGGLSAMADFQNSFTAKDLERDAAREALLLAVSNKGTVSFCLSKPNLTHFFVLLLLCLFSRESVNVRLLMCLICVHTTAFYFSRIYVLLSFVEPVAYCMDT